MVNRREEREGWVGSILVHAAIVTLLFLITVSDEITMPEFVEVAWGSGTPGVVPASASPAPASTGAPAESPPMPSPVHLPERRNLRELEELVAVPPREERVLPETPTQRALRVDRESFGERELDLGRGLGDKENFPGVGAGAYIGELSDSRVHGEIGRGVGSSISFSLEWVGGGTRRLLSGTLPEYPPGVQVEAQIKLQATVEPDGSVKSLQPMQKGDPRLERAAIDKVQFWKFEPLPAVQTQVDQTCVIAFQFRLE